MNHRGYEIACEIAQGVLDRVKALSERERNDLRKALPERSPTNCWWVVHRMRDPLAAIIEAVEDGRADCGTLSETPAAPHEEGSEA